MFLGVVDGRTVIVHSEAEAGTRLADVLDATLGALDHIDDVAKVGVLSYFE